RQLLGDPRGLLAQPGGAEVAHILAARRRALAPTALRLAELAQRGELSQAPAMLYPRDVHLHLHPLGGIDAQAQPRVLGLLLRTREGLARAPLGPIVEAQADDNRTVFDVPVAVMTD